MIKTIATYDDQLRLVIAKKDNDYTYLEKSRDAKLQIKEYKNIEGKLVGKLNIADGVYTSHRTTKHYMFIKKGYGISISILKKLETDGCKTIRLVVEESTGTQIYVCAFEKYLHSKSTHPNTPSDLQHFVEVKRDMTNLNKQEEKSMGNIKDTATAYEAPSTRNITELEVVRVDADIIDKQGTNASGETWDYKVIIVDNFEYRVPLSVLGNLKAILKENANLATFKVTKQGEGMNTKYTVIPLG